MLILRECVIAAVLVMESLSSLREDYPCAKGWYGYGCETKCHCWGETVCGRWNGTCRDGCAQGYEGVDCQTKHNAKGADKNAMTAGIAIALLFLVVMVSPVTSSIAVWYSGADKNAMTAGADKNAMTAGIVIALLFLVVIVSICSVVYYKCCIVSRTDGKGGKREKRSKWKDQHKDRLAREAAYMGPGLDVHRLSAIDNWHLEGSKIDFPPIRPSELDFKISDTEESFDESTVDSSMDPGNLKRLRALRCLTRYAPRTQRYYRPRGYRPTLYDVMALDHDLINIGLCPYSGGLATGEAGRRGEFVTAEQNAVDAAIRDTRFGQGHDEPRNIDPGVDFRTIGLGSKTPDFQTSDAKRTNQRMDGVTFRSNAQQVGVSDPLTWERIAEQIAMLPLGKPNGTTIPGDPMHTHTAQIHPVGRAQITSVPNLGDPLHKGSQLKDNLPEWERLQKHGYGVHNDPRRWERIATRIAYHLNKQDVQNVSVPNPGHVVGDTYTREKPGLESTGSHRTENKPNVQNIRVTSSSGAHSIDNSALGRMTSNKTGKKRNISGQTLGHTGAADVSRRKKPTVEIVENTRDDVGVHRAAPSRRQQVDVRSQLGTDEKVRHEAVHNQPDIPAERSNLETMTTGIASHPVEAWDPRVWEDMSPTSDVISQPEVKTQRVAFGNENVAADENRYRENITVGIISQPGGKYHTAVYNQPDIAGDIRRWENMEVGTLSHAMKI